MAELPPLEERAPGGFLVFFWVEFVVGLLCTEGGKGLLCLMGLQLLEAIHHLGVRVCACAHTIGRTYIVAFVFQTRSSL